ncbi:ATP-binding protein [Thiohalorhabdus sp. Cl-TMA]|uniref:histidine kinase n=1 Tax=Thiohalorhabdus methylotrophus TaxID=3242694 RepID=A0ABV4TVS6_9GAMM
MTNRLDESEGNTIPVNGPPVPALRKPEEDEAEGGHSVHGPEALVELYADFYESAPVAYFTCDRTGKVYSVNRAGCDLLDRNREQLLGRSLQDFLLGSEKPELEGFLGELFAGIGRASLEVHLKPGDGRDATVALEGAISRARPGGQELALLTGWDISRKREAEQLQHRADRALRALNAANQAMRWAPDEHTLLQEICHFLVRGAGYALAWIGEPARMDEQGIRVLASADLDGCLERIQDPIAWGFLPHGRGPFGQALETGKPALVANVALTPQFALWGEQAAGRGFQSVLAVPLRDEDRVLGVLCIYADEAEAFDAYELNLLCRLADETANAMVSFRARQAQYQAERERDRLVELLNATPDAVTIADSLGEILYANPGAFRMVGRSPGCESDRALLGDFLAPASAERLQQEVFPEARKAGLWMGEMTLRHAKGRDIPVAMVAVAHKDDAGQVERFSVMAHDLSQFKSQQAELERTRRLVTLGELGSVLAHQLNQPLATAMNFAQGALQRLESQDEAGSIQYGLEQILDYVRQAGEIVWGVRHFLRSGEPKARPTELNQLIRRLTPDHLQDGMHSFRLDLDLDPGLPHVKADPILLQECFSNLIQNAVDAMEAAEEEGEEQGVVTVRTRRHSDQMVEVQVADQGRGLPQDLQEDLVQPLFTTKSGGMGLGISICRSIVESHNGYFWAAPNSPEPGTTFHLTLPVCQEQKNCEEGPDGPGQGDTNRLRR